MKEYFSLTDINKNFENYNLENQHTQNNSNNPNF